MKQLLLDTHALLWWLGDSPKLPREWRAALSDAGTRVCVSAATIWEIAIKTSVGRLDLKLPAGVTLEGLGTACGFEDLPVLAAHAAGVRALPPLHADPFDRLLIAQARHEGLSLVTLDAQIRRYGGAVLGA